MKNIRFSQLILVALLCALTILSIGCATSASSRYFGKTTPPRENVLRYISGSEIETLDPQISDGQPEARVYLALFDGLVEYHPKTMQPIPALAERWEASPTNDEFIFYLRKNARFSNGDPITAHDFVWSIRRGMDAATRSRNAAFGYKIRHGKAFNAKESFVRKNGEFLLEKDFLPEGVTAKPEEPYKALGAETEFNKRIKASPRLIAASDEKGRAKQIEGNPKLKAAFEGAELVPVTKEDIGVEAIDDYTVRITLTQPAPYFLGLLPHQFFRVVPPKIIEKHGKAWTRPENYVTSGAFKLKKHQPYHLLEIEKDPMYWDAANVKLDGIRFYPSEEQTTMMNLYVAGDIDAVYNRTVPASWNEVREYKDEYLLHPEGSVEYQVLNVRKPPMDKLETRRAFALAIDRVALAKFRKIARPLYGFTPDKIFPEYEAARARVSEELRAKSGQSAEEWNKRYGFDVAKACDYMKKAGYRVTPRDGGRCTVEDFPVDKSSITYNTAESNKAVAEFVQAQWKQNLGLTIPLKNMEWKTFLEHRKSLQYDSMGRSGWVGDYMDPHAFLYVHYGAKNEGSTGWHDPVYDKMLDDANREPDPTKRYEMLARAEFYMLDQQIVIPLTVSGTNWIKKPYVKGMYPNPATMHPWKFVYIERDPNLWDKNVDNIMTDVDPRFEEQLKSMTATQK
jgi:oligopeptide transport system substrate-binding protein